MNATRHTLLAAATLFFAAIPHALAQSGNLAVDPALAAQIASIQAIDNHAHPLLAPSAYATDRNFDALLIDTMAPTSTPHVPQSELYG
jgi:hypothetical protein